MRIERMIATALGAVVFFMLLVAGPASRSFAAGADPVIAAAGDIACDSLPSAKPEADDAGGNVCHMGATAKLIAALHPAAVLTLGDEQYADGTLAQFENGYDKTWGAFRTITRPAPGNHEYHTPGAAGYYGYFGASAGDPAKGYYSFDLGGWHLIALNANCKQIGGCGADSPEVQWLAKDLAAHHAACTLAYWHQPRFSSGPHHSDATYDAFWRALYATHADLVLNGHDHDYERFAPQTPEAKPDPSLGITEIVAGTGGRSHYKIGSIEPNSAVSNGVTYGVLALTLHPHAFDWRFIPEPGSTFSDAGSHACHG
jgi:hypothetical protein